MIGYSGRRYYTLKLKDRSFNDRLYIVDYLYLDSDREAIIVTTSGEEFKLSEVVKEEVSGKVRLTYIKG